MLTLEGLRKLVYMKEKPKDWEIEVLEYLICKREIYEKMKEKLENVKRDFEEALLLAKQLGVI